MSQPTQPNAVSEEQSDLPSLVVQFGSTRRKDRPLNKVTTILGRSRACDVTLDAPDVAAMHCLITRTGAGELFIRDCQSRSGTLLNEQPIREALAKDGDVLQVGPFTFTIRVPEAPPSDSAPPRPVSPPIEAPASPMAKAVDDGEIRKLQQQLAEQQQSLGQQITEVELRQTELDQGLQQLHDERASLERERVEFQEQQRAAAQQFDQGRQELEQLRDELERRQAELAVRPTQIDDGLRKQIEADARAKMRSEFEAGELSVLNGEIERLASVLSDSTNERDQLLQRVQELEKFAATGGGEVESLQEQVETLTQRCQAIAAERDELKAYFESQPAPSEGGAPIDPQIAAENERLKQEVAAATERARLLEEKLQRVDEESDRRLASLRSELDDERRRTKELVKEAAADYERTRNEISVLKEQLQQSSGGNSAEQARLQAEVDSLHDTVAKLQAELDAKPHVPADLAEYESQLNEFRASLEDAQAELETQEQKLQEKIKQSELQLSRDRANLARQQADLDRLRAEFRVELEHAEREAKTQAKMAPFQKLKEEMRQEQAPAPDGSTPLAERIRNILKRIN